MMVIAERTMGSRMVAMVCVVTRVAVLRILIRVQRAAGAGGVHEIHSDKIEEEYGTTTEKERR